MNKHIDPPCNNHFIHRRISIFATENATFPFAQTDLSIEEVASVVRPRLYPNPPAEIVVEEETVTSVESLQARGESNDHEEMIDVVGGGEAGVRSGAESEGSTFVDALRRANLVAASDPETVFDTSGMPTCKYFLYDNL